jgi:hypothetical protein
MTEREEFGEGGFSEGRSTGGLEEGGGEATGTDDPDS